LRLIYVGEKKMKKKWQLTFAACLLLLAGCAQLDKECRQCVLDGFDSRLIRQPLPLLPNIFINQTGKIVLDQSPIRIYASDLRDGMVKISWALPAGSDYTFPENGIQIGPVPTKEGPRTPGKPVSCGKESKKADAASFQITGIELKGSIKTVIPPKLQCPVKGELRKVIECSFAPPKGLTIYKYSVYVCRGQELFDSYDPYIVSDI
jgi:hypothetical protein